MKQTVRSITVSARTKDAKMSKDIVNTTGESVF